MVDRRASYISLALAPGIGATRLTTLLQTFGTPDRAQAAPFEFLCRLPGFSRAAASAVRSARPELGQGILDRVQVLGGRCLLPEDAEYPESLRAIPESPPLLFALGDLSLLDRAAVAIVGSRDHSSYGGEVCRELASAAAQSGLAVVSGMARGLDAVAHEAALDAAGATIGVLGNGLGVVYPAANRSLYERVAREGLLLTEFPPGERPHAGSFPRRNRLISGLARVTVVIEAAFGSGTLITVEAALEQGREVMAVPGAITSPTSMGTNRLIRDGAAPLLEIGDLLQHYPEIPPARRPPPPTEQMRPGLSSALSPDEERVLRALGSGGMQLDQLTEAVGLPAGPLLALLAQMEIGGLVEQGPGPRFAPAPRGSSPLGTAPSAR